MPARPRRSRLFRLAALCCPLLTLGCGYVGDPLLPALNLPKTITDLRAVEHGDRIRLDFTIAPLTTEGLPLKHVTEVELRLWPGDNKPFALERMIANSRPVPATATGPGEVKVEIPAAEWVGHELFFTVRAFGPSHHASGWSGLALVTVVPPLAAPAPGDLKAEATAGGVRLRWQYPSTPDLSFRIYRAVEKDERELVDTAPASGWVDAKSEFDKQYRYAIQAVRKAGQGDAESPISEPVSIRPQDTFPPAVPKGPNAVPGLTSVELTWEPNTEPDFAFYRIYRSASGAAFAPLADKVAAPSYSDRKVESGKVYRYRISSVDRLGNESEQSAPVEVTAP